MDKKKQYINQSYMPLYAVFSLALASFFLICFSFTSFASELTPSNQMTAEIAKNIITYVTDNSVCDYVSSLNSYKTFWNNFSTHVNYEDFAIAWNSSEIPNNCDYLEQCVLVLSSYDNKPFFKVFFNNNMIGNNLSHLGIKKVSTTTFNYYYLDDNNTRVTGNRVHISLTDTGSVNFNLQSNPASGNNSGVINGGGFALDPENSIFTLIPLFTIGLHNSIYIDQDRSWRFNISSSVVEIPASEPDPPDVPVDTGNTGTITDNNGDKTGQIDLSGIQAGIGNINNNINTQGQAIVDKVEETGQAIINTIEKEPETTEEDFVKNFPEVDIDDPSDDFFSWIFEQIENVFTSTSPQTFEFSLYTDNVYTVNSNDIRVPDGVVKTLIGLSCDFSICYWIIKDVRKVINKIKEGSIEALASEDITANMV